MMSLNLFGNSGISRDNWSQSYSKNDSHLIPFLARPQRSHAR